MDLVSFSPNGSSLSAKPMWALIRPGRGSFCGAENLRRQTRVHSRWHVAIQRNLTCLILCGDFGNDLGHGSFKLLDADVLKDDRALGEQPHVRGHLFTLQCENKMEHQWRWLCDAKLS